MANNVKIFENNVFILKIDMANHMHGCVAPTGKTAAIRCTLYSCSRDWRVSPWNPPEYNGAIVLRDLGGAFIGPPVCREALVPRDIYRIFLQNFRM